MLSVVEARRVHASHELHQQVHPLLWLWVRLLLPLLLPLLLHLLRLLLRLLLPLLLHVPSPPLHGCLGKNAASNSLHNLLLLPAACCSCLPASLPVKGGEALLLEPLHV